MNELIYSVETFSITKYEMNNKFMILIELFYGI